MLSTLFVEAELNRIEIIANKKYTLDQMLFIHQRLRGYKNTAVSSAIDEICNSMPMNSRLPSLNEIKEKVVKLKADTQQSPGYAPIITKRESDSEYTKECRDIARMIAEEKLTGEPLKEIARNMAKKWPGKGWEDFGNLNAGRTRAARVIPCAITGCTKEGTMSHSTHHDKADHVPWVCRDHWR